MTRRAACALQALQVVERSEPDVGGLLRRMVSTTASDRPSAIQLIKAFKQLRMPRLLSLFALAGSDVRCALQAKSPSRRALVSTLLRPQGASGAARSRSRSGCPEKIISCIHQTHDSN